MDFALNIAIINTDSSVPTVNARVGSYGAIFHQVLQSAASRIQPQTQIRSAEFDAVKGELPSTTSEYLGKVDAILVSGSVHTVYKSQGNDWISSLDAFIGYVYFNHPHIRIFGSCFGHQIISQSLLRRLGVDAHVEKNPAGWELGVHEIEFTETFRKAMTPLVVKRTNRRTLEDLKIQLVHGDQVKLSVCGDGTPNLPPSWSVVGSTQKCAIQGVHQPGRVLTFQGHFEFDAWTNVETIKAFGDHWNDCKRVNEGVRGATDSRDDGQEIAELVFLFLTEGRDTMSNANHVTGLGEHGQITSNLGQRAGLGWLPWRHLRRLLSLVDDLMSQTTKW